MTEEIAPGLRRWTTPFERWQEVMSSFAVDTDDGLVLIDPNMSHGEPVLQDGRADLELLRSA